MPKSKRGAKSFYRKLHPIGTPTEYAGIKYRSTIEAFAASIFDTENIPVEYEVEKFDILPEFEYKNSSWEPHKYRKKITFKPSTKRPSITFTPDFIGKDMDGNLLWVMECKGRMTRDFPLRWKMFKKLLKDTGREVPLFLPTSQKHVLAAVEEIKRLYPNIYGKNGV